MDPQLHQLENHHRFKNHNSVELPLLEDKDFNLHHHQKLQVSIGLKILNYLLILNMEEIPKSEIHH